MRRLLTTLLLTGLATSAWAYTPESGIWYNPQEPGNGLALEIQDNMLAMTVYTYDQNGMPTWYISAGEMNGNARYVGQLDGYDNGQCFGCTQWRRPDIRSNAGGPVEIIFDPNDQSKATITWGGRTMPIIHEGFGFKRSQDGNAPVEVTKMLGEWQAVMDVSSDRDSSYAYLGEAMVFNTIRSDASTYFYDGCRPDNSTSGQCSSNALSQHSASGYYKSDTGVHVVVVDDGRNSSGRNVCILYLLATDLQAFRGAAEMYYCGNTPRYDTPFKVRGFRTASRQFVTTQSGPSAVGDGMKAFKKTPGMLHDADTLPTASTAKAADLVSKVGGKEALNDIVAKLEARLNIK